MQTDAILPSAQPCHLHCHQVKLHKAGGDGRVVRWCLVNFPCRGRPSNLDNIGAGGGVFGRFSLVYLFSFLYPSLGEGGMHKSHRNSGAQIENTMPIPVCCLISRNVAV